MYVDRFHTILRYRINVNVYSFVFGFNSHFLGSIHQFETFEKEYIFKYCYFQMKIHPNAYIGFWTWYDWNHTLIFINEKNNNTCVDAYQPFCKYHRMLFNVNICSFQNCTEYLWIGDVGTHTKQHR